MSRRLELLRELLGATAITRGVLIARQGDTAQVATSAGTRLATIPQGLVLSPGDTLRLQDGVVLGRVRDRLALPVYDL